MFKQTWHGFESCIMPLQRPQNVFHTPHSCCGSCCRSCTFCSSTERVPTCQWGLQNNASDQRFSLLRRPLLECLISLLTTLPAGGGTYNKILENEAQTLFQQTPEFHLKLLYDLTLNMIQYCMYVVSLGMEEKVWSCPPYSSDCFKVLVAQSFNLCLLFDHVCLN